VRGHLRPGRPEHVFVTSPRTWAQAGPETAEGIARSVIDFAAQVLTEDHEDVVDTLRQLEAVGVGRAGSLITHPLDHDLIAGRTGLCQGETSSVADLVKG
jgi:hypothetical protein